MVDFQGAEEKTYKCVDVEHIGFAVDFENDQ